MTQWFECNTMKSISAKTLFLCLFWQITIYSGSCAQVNSNPDIPVPKSITVGKRLSKAEKDLLVEVALNFYAFWNTGKGKYLKLAVSPDFFDNTLPTGRPQGFGRLLFASNNFRKSVPDLKCSIEDLIITKDKIICRQFYTGHNSGPTGSHPASNNEIRFFAIDILHVRNGKVFEDWHLEDNLTFLIQAGVVKL
jgi:predicted ester cyclase